MMGKKRYAFALALLVVAAVAYRLNHSPTPGDIASKTLLATERGEAETLWELTSEDERKGYGLSKEKVRALVTEANFRQALVPDGQLQEYEDASSGGAVASRWYKLKDGSRAVFSSDAEIRERHKPVARRPLTQLIYLHLYLSGRRATGNASESPEKALIFLRGIERQSRRLTTLGFSGVLDEQSDRLVTWAELKVEFERRYQRSLAEKQS